MPFPAAQIAANTTTPNPATTMNDLAALAAAMRQNPEDRVPQDMFIDELMNLTSCDRNSAAHVAHSIYAPARTRLHMRSAAALLTLNGRAGSELRVRASHLARIAPARSLVLIVAKGQLPPMNGYDRSSRVHWEDMEAETPPINARTGEAITSPPGVAFLVVGATWVTRYCEANGINLPPPPPPPHQNDNGE